MSHEPLEKVYDPRAVEPEVYRQWEEVRAFEARPDGRPHAQTYTIVIPPPNVTGALHLGHALNNTLQDILIRYHRMRGFNTLWQPGTDHAGIATQAVVERRIRETEGKTRHQLGATEQECREELVRRIWQWKDEYEKRIISQLKLMGCSCDWSRNRFTLDEGLARAVRHMFFMLFRDGLIFRGKRLVNWDTQLQTAVSDDEVYYEAVKGHFWHIRYPVVGDEGTERRSDEASHEATEPRSHEEPDYVVIATTRPETMLGDVAVAVHPDPEGFFDRKEAELREAIASLATRSGKEAAEIQTKLEALAERRQSHLPLLIKLRDMARAGRKLRLPLVDRIIPLITDEWADPTLGTGCVKITPAHDPNDYEVGLRHNLPLINVLTPDGKIAPIIEPDPAAAPCKPSASSTGSAAPTEAPPGGGAPGGGAPGGAPPGMNAGARDQVNRPHASGATGCVNVNSQRYAGLVFSSEGREKVVADLEAGGFLDHVEDRDIELGHSDRSKLPIEPYLSDQWFVRTGEPESQISNLKSEISNLQSEMPNLKFGISDLRSDGLAQAAMDAVTTGRIQVFPSRYAKSYLDWLGEKRDWCISRQLWWGHRIRVWSHRYLDDKGAVSPQAFADVPDWNERIAPWGKQGRIAHFKPKDDFQLRKAGDISWSFCIREPDGADREIVHYFESKGFKEDPDVLDTWFSSALWPFSTLGWPEETPSLKQYYPGSVLCTSRDIITNWVARMVMFGLYAMGEVPFDHVYIHPKILDGRGETMSKSKGNGVDPVDIIHTHGADAMRYTLADMTTETQDIRMPVEYVCPHCGALIDQALALKNEEQARKSRGVKLERKLQPSDLTRVTCVAKECGKPFATQWADPAVKQEVGLGRETSDKFDIGRNFCNKLWNAARYTFESLAQLGEAPGASLDVKSLLPEDRWILARLSETIRQYHVHLGRYEFSASVKALRDFFWDGLCDWYLELTKPRIRHTLPLENADRALDNLCEDPKTGDPRQVLAFCLDQVLRLWHPTIPFITERLWQQLNTLVPQRGIPGIADLKCDTDLIVAPFPPVEGYPALDDPEILTTFAELQDATRGVRDLRSAANVPPKQKVTVTVIVPQGRLEAFRHHAHIVRHMAGIGELHVVSSGKRPANAASLTLGALRIFVHDISDDAAERTRSKKALEAVLRQIAGSEAKLSNEKFVANAKPDVVEAERTRLAELIAQRDNLQAHLAELG